MFTRIAAKNFRCLKQVDQELAPFQILVGPNGSGKSAFLDVPAFLGAIVSKGLENAIVERTPNYDTLVWSRSPKGLFIELVIEATPPSALTGVPVSVRYEVVVRLDPDTDTPQIFEEKLLLRGERGERAVISRLGRFAEFAGENGVPELDRYQFHGTIAALANVPEDETKFPVTTWLKRFLSQGVRRIELDGKALRGPSAPHRGQTLLPDGSNLARVVDQLTLEARRDWLRHLQTALPDLKDIGVTEFLGDRNQYLLLKYAGVELPAGAVSDGTLRLLALTVLAYSAIPAVYLIEEPENGIHPAAVETAYQSLSSVYEGQVLAATHSPVLLSLVRPEQVLCFAQSPGTGTSIIRGDRHPALRDWRGQVSLGDLLVSGVLNWT